MEYFMKNIHKILFLVATLSLLVFLPCKQSSANDLKMQDTAFLLNPVSSSALKGNSFNQYVTFAKYEKDILQDDTHILEVQNLENGCDVSFKSSDTDILDVKQLSDTSCSYTGVGYGKAKITVTITKTTAFFFKEKRTIRASIKVTPKAVSVMFRQGTRKIASGRKLKLPLTIRPSISEEIPTFRSLNKKVVSIAKNGKITGKKPGTTFVTATLLNGKTAKCKIVVLEQMPDNEPDDDWETED
jgi:hypothetical protein